MDQPSDPRRTRYDYDGCDDSDSHASGRLTALVQRPDTGDHDTRSGDDSEPCPTRRVASNPEEREEVDVEQSEDADPSQEGRHREQNAAPNKDERPSNSTTCHGYTPCKRLA